MRIVDADHPIALDELRGLARGRSGDMVKVVVDLGRGVMMLDAGTHADQEAALLATGSVRRELWGINVYPNRTAAEWLEFGSMINCRPSFGNRSRGVDDAQRREQIVGLLTRLVQR